MTRQAPAILADGSGNAAALTLSISIYSVFVLVTLGLALNAYVQGRRRTGNIWAAVLATLILIGVLIAILSTVI